MESPNLESRVATLEKEVASLHQKLEEARIDARIRRGIEQANRGELIPAREALESIRRKYNIQAP